MKSFKKIAKIDKFLAGSALVMTALYAVGMGVYELVQKLDKSKPEETKPVLKENTDDIEVEVYEETEDSGIDAANEPELFEDTVGEVDDNEVVDFEEETKE